jgi:serine/threonine protein phosphatase PrpC
VICVPRDPSDQLMILATDGLWDVFTNEEVHALAWARFQRELGKGRPPPVRRCHAELYQCKNASP